MLFCRSILRTLVYSKQFIQAFLHILKRFQRYLSTFRDINAYSAKLTDAQLGTKGKVFPALFKNRS